ncbi:hypothetical protein PL9214100011 [Planktothrix tepida PCC 9214]|uniref:Uncharacterized protein n=1 Tax=Planktothrix tepida PCC 9214 TaxID=671072 RepID=A0A1J1LC42_9CYAN|nr:hypothetical protein PL9214100011 [Planktothrix tepida PCC 9214]
MCTVPRNCVINSDRKYIRNLQKRQKTRQNHHVSPELGMILSGLTNIIVNSRLGRLSSNRAKSAVKKILRMYGTEYLEPQHPHQVKGLRLGRFGLIRSFF